MSCSACTSSFTTSYHAPDSPASKSKIRSVDAIAASKPGFDGSLTVQAISPEKLLMDIDVRSARRISSEDLIIIDLRENRHYQTAHIVGAKGASCYTKIMTKRAILTWTNWFPDKENDVDEGYLSLPSSGFRHVVLYDQKSSAPKEDSPVMMYIKFLRSKVHKISFLKGGFDGFRKLNRTDLISSCYSDDAIQSYQCSRTNQDTCSEDVLNATASKILSHLYLGNERDANDIDLLRSHKITHILNVTNNVAFSNPDNQFIFCRLDATDCHEQDLMQHFDKAFSFIDDALNNNGRVLVHCWAGVSRSATIVVAYLMKNSSYNVADTLSFVRNRRSIVEPNFNFLGQLERFQCLLEAGKETRTTRFDDILTATELSASSSESQSSSGSSGNGCEFAPFLRFS